jgi:uridine kinase
VSRILVGVAGGSAAGKTTMCERIKSDMEFDNDLDITIIPLDAFYKSVNKEKVDVAEYNFDHPDALDFDLALQVY